jgi:hypothetical protein
MSAADPRDGRWIKHAGWQQNTDYSTGYKYASIGRAGDFHASVTERPVISSSWRGRPKEYAWHVSRQRTMWEERQPGYDPASTHWTHVLDHGVEPTMAKARSAAMSALRVHRALHIEAGGDVGYPSYRELAEREER